MYVCMYVRGRFATKPCGQTETLRWGRNTFWIKRKPILEVLIIVNVCMYVCMYLYVGMYVFVLRF